MYQRKGTEMAHWADDQVAVALQRIPSKSMTLTALQEATGIGPSDLETCLTGLEEEGVIKEEGAEITWVGYQASPPADPGPEFDVEVPPVIPAGGPPPAAPTASAVPSGASFEGQVQVLQAQIEEGLREMIAKGHFALRAEVVLEMGEDGARVRNVTRILGIEPLDG